MPNDLFKIHAAPEAIEVALRRARAQRSRWQREVDVLEELLVRRSGERERGEWPSRPEGEGGPLLTPTAVRDPSLDTNSLVDEEPTDDRS